MMSALVSAMDFPTSVSASTFTPKGSVCSVLSHPGANLHKANTTDINGNLTVNKTLGKNDIFQSIHLETMD